MAGAKGQPISGNEFELVSATLARGGPLQETAIDAIGPGTREEREPITRLGRRGERMRELVCVFADSGPFAQRGAVVEQDVHGRNRRLAGQPIGHNPVGH